jgi:hypothetical protein
MRGAVDGLGAVQSEVTENAAEDADHFALPWSQGECPVNRPNRPTFGSPCVQQTNPSHVTQNEPGVRPGLPQTKH